MKNNKGQTLVIFVVFLPILIIIMATTIDVGLMYYEKNKLDNLNILAIDYGINNIDNENFETKVKEFINKNDSDITIDTIQKSNDSIKIVLNKTMKSTFGKVIGLKEYKISSTYSGTNIENKKEIKKG